VPQLKGGSLCRSLIPRQKQVSVEHGGRDVSDAATRPAGLAAQQLERIAFANCPPFHENSLGALDHGAPL
jgi:hypothetical protein